MRQGDTLIAVKDFGFQPNGKGRIVEIRKGQRFWVTTSQVAKQTLIAREGSGRMSQGWFFTAEQLAELFACDCDRKR